MSPWHGSTVPGPFSSRSVDAIVAAASPSSSSSSSSTNMTPVIVGVSVGVGSLLLLVMGYRIWKCTRRPKAPLPPKGPLAHDRQRQMASAYTQSELQSPPNIAPFAGQALYGEHSRHPSSQTDSSSTLPPSPSMSSQAHLLQTPPGSELNGEITRQRRPSFGSTASTVRHQYGHGKRTMSNAGSIHSTRSRQSSSQGTIRGAPHARHNRVDIVLPQPLAPGLYNNHGSPRQSPVSHSRASSRERLPESRGEEYWTGRVSMDGASLSTHDSAVSSNYPHTPAEYPPPVPPLPVGYSTTSSTATSPSVSEAPSPLLSDVPSPNFSGPLLAQFSPSGSPASGPPPLPPPKDTQPRHSSRTRTRRRSESAQRP